MDMIINGSWRWASELGRPRDWRDPKKTYLMEGHHFLAPASGWHGMWKPELKTIQHKIGTKFLKNTDRTSKTWFGLKAATRSLQNSSQYFTSGFSSSNPITVPILRQHQMTQIKGHLMRCLASTLQNCQGHDEQGKTGNLSEVRRA